MVTRADTGLFLVLTLTWAVAANAQAIRPPSSIEVFAGHAGFADEATIEHSVFGGSGRIYLTPRISLGPEITYMRGPGDDRDWFFLGNLTFDVRSPTAGRSPRVSPFVIAGAGFFTHSDRVGTGIYTSGEGTFAAGAGTRVHITDRVYATGDLRFGWEWHYRITAGIGLTL
jgi:hypothetical protein